MKMASSLVVRAFLLPWKPTLEPIENNSEKSAIWYQKRKGILKKTDVFLWILELYWSFSVFTRFFFYEPGLECKRAECAGLAYP